MTAKEFLNQAHQLDQRIASKQEQIAILENMATKCTPTLTGMPHNQSSTISPMEDAVCRIADIKKELVDELTQLLVYKVNILEVIHKIKKLEYKIILEKRYLSYQSWESIATDLQYSTSWVLKLHKKALKAVDVILAEKEGVNELS